MHHICSRKFCDGWSLMQSPIALQNAIDGNARFLRGAPDLSAFASFCKFHVDFFFLISLLICTLLLRPLLRPICLSRRYVRHNATPQLLLLLADGIFATCYSNDVSTAWAQGDFDVRSEEISTTCLHIRARLTRDKFLIDGS